MMSKGSAAKITISLPDNLVDYATAKAEKLGISRFQVIAEALAQQQARDQAELAVEGYRFYAEEAKAFAEASLPARSMRKCRLVPCDRGTLQIPGACP
jgi:hypothetical protein